MASLINPNKIDKTYPVAGQNNSTNGMRNNFAATSDNFQETANEINDLINKVIVSAPLTYGINSNVNNFGGMYSANLTLFSYGEKVWNNGLAIGTVTADFANGSVQTYSLNGTDSSLNVVNFPGIGESELILDFNTSSPTSISFGQLNVITPDVPGYDSGNNYFYVTDTNANTIIKMSSNDGKNWKLSKFNASYIPTHTPSSSIGAYGDTSGSVTHDSSYLYVCTANFDGLNSIWKRVALESF